MKNKLKKYAMLFIAGFISVFLLAILSLFSILPYWIPILLAVVVCCISCPVPLFYCTNILLKKTKWYDSIYGDCVKFKKQKFNTQVVNLGSSQGKYAFDYSKISVLGANWAVAPQPLSDDFRILKNYHSYIKEGGYVLFPLCPFSGFVEDYADINHFRKCHYFLHPILNPHFSETIFQSMKREVEFPLLTVIKNPYKSLKGILKNDFLKRTFALKPFNPMNKVQLENDAANRIESWKKEFSLRNLSDALSSTNQNSIDFNNDLLCEIVDFCTERSLTPIVIIPPVTRQLSEAIPADFRQKTLYAMLKKAQDEKGLKVLDYFDDERFTDYSLYFNSFLLNAKGRELFTKQVLNDLGLLKSLG